MEREVCVRCGGTMGNIGQEKLQLGEYGVPFGHLSQMFAGALRVDIYCCRNCRKLEFYAVESPEAREDGGIAQVLCPGCGQLHDMDDPRCPHCGKRLLE